MTGFKELLLKSMSMEAGRGSGGKVFAVFGGGQGSIKSQYGGTGLWSQQWGSRDRKILWTFWSSWVRKLQGQWEPALKNNVENDGERYSMVGSGFHPPHTLKIKPYQRLRRVIGLVNMVLSTYSV